MAEFHPGITNKKNKSRKYWQNKRNSNANKRSVLTELIESGQLQLTSILNRMDIAKDTRSFESEDVPIGGILDEEDNTMYYNMSDLFAIQPNLTSVARLAMLMADVNQKIGERCKESEKAEYPKWRLFTIDDSNKLNTYIKVQSGPLKLELASASTHIKKVSPPASSLMFTDTDIHQGTLYKKTLFLRLRPVQPMLTISASRILFVLYAYRYGKHTPDLRPMHPSGMVYTPDTSSDFDITRHIKFDPWIVEGGLPTISITSSINNPIPTNTETENSICVICQSNVATQTTFASCNHITYCDDCVANGRRIELKPCHTVGCSQTGDDSHKSHSVCPLCRSIS